LQAVILIIFNNKVLKRSF